MSDRQQSFYFIAIVFLFTCGAALLVYRGYESYYQQNVDAELSAAATPVQIPLPNSGTWKNYVNDHYGFSMMVPKDYTESIHTSDGNTAVFFEMPTTDAAWIKANGSSRAAVFEILPFSNSQYQAMIKNCASPSESSMPACQPKALQQNFLGNNNDYYFYYGRIDQVGDYPSDFKPQLFDQADEIIKGFKLFNLK